MKIGLIDVDGHNFPNVALMKIASWHRQQGDHVEWVNGFEPYDRIYKSKVFTFTPDDLTAYQCRDIRKGGTGYDIKSRLPEEIDRHTGLAYDLYPQHRFSVQFYSRGCIRHCPFCLVHDKEGAINAVEPMEWNPNADWIEVLDNNFFAGPRWREAVEDLRKRGLLGHAMGKPTPTLKKCFDGHSPYGVFVRELHEHIVQLRKHGLFFSFTTDPLLPETQDLTNAAVLYAVSQGVPCKILTKRADFKVPDSFYPFQHLIAYGFTLTGMDAMELAASSNQDRIATMEYLHNRGFKTFASIEPVIDIEKSKQMIAQTLGYCDLYKIGLMSGHKDYTREQVAHFVVNINDMVLNHNFDHCEDVKVYWKDSVLEFLKMDKEYRHNVSPFSWRFDMSCHVDADYDMFS